MTDELMKDAFHKIWGGSPKHDAVPDLFASGWNALFEALGGDQHFMDLRIDPQWDHTSWTIQHPVTERLDGSLFECPLTVAGAEISHYIAPEGAGIYRIWEDRNSIQWEKMD